MFSSHPLEDNFQQPINKARDWVAPWPLMGDPPHMGAPTRSYFKFVRQLPFTLSAGQTPSLKPPGHHDPRARRTIEPPF
jgi:hypothetical protein